MEKKKVSFDAVIKKNPEMDAGYISFPFNVEELYGLKGQMKVKAVFDDHVIYRGSLAKMGGSSHFLGMTKAIRQELGKSFGDIVKVDIEPDPEARTVIIPAEIQILLDEEPEALAYFEGLSFTDRKEYIIWLTSAKKEETRRKRLITFIEKLLAKKKLNDK